jgi:hypothetical protein
MRLDSLSFNPQVRFIRRENSVRADRACVEIDASSSRATWL